MNIKTVVTLIFFALIGVASIANAGNHKTDVWHCGCATNDAGTELRWTMLSISEKSKGHKNHIFNQHEDCVSTVINDDGSTTSTTHHLMRAASDCQDTDILMGVGVCPAQTDGGTVDPVEGEICGEADPHDEP